MKQFMVPAKRPSVLSILTSATQASNQYPITLLGEKSLLCEAEQIQSKFDLSFEIPFEITVPQQRFPVKGLGRFIELKNSRFEFEIINWQTDSDSRWHRYFETRLCELTAADIMTANVLTVSPSEPVHQVIAKIQAIHAGSAMVVDEERKVLGIFTERDVLSHALKAQFLQHPVSAYMTQSVSTVPETASADQIYSLFSHVQFRHLPVVTAGKLQGIISIRDLTKYWTKLLEVQKRNLTKKYDKAMGVIVHDLRSPINAIRAINESLLNGLDTPQDYVLHQFPQMIDDSCATMVQLIDELLQLTQSNHELITLERTNVDFSSLVESVVESFTPIAAKKNIVITTAVSGSPRTLFADKTRILQVVQNLISNAVKYSSFHSKVEIQLHYNQSEVEFTVIDHGQGIKIEELPYVFDELCKISSKPTANEPSTGLGLSIVKRLVAAHGGSISVNSSPNSETQFRVTLPASPITKAA